MPSIRLWEEKARSGRETSSTVWCVMVTTLKRMSTTSIRIPVTFLLIATPWEALYKVEQRRRRRHSLQAKRPKGRAPELRSPTRSLSQRRNSAQAASETISNLLRDHLWQQLRPSLRASETINGGIRDRQRQAHQYLMGLNTRSFMLKDLHELQGYLLSPCRLQR